MKKSVLLTSAVLLSLSNLVFASSMQSLNKSEVTDALQNKTITTIPLVTMNGKLINNAFTGYFGKDGTLEGQLATKPENDPQTDQGKWTVNEDGTLCATWDHWHKAKPICVAIYKLKNSMVFVNKNSDKLETIVLDNNIKTGKRMS